MLRASHLALAALTDVRELLIDARDDLEQLVSASAHGIGGAELNTIKPAWNAMNGGTVQKLRDALSRIDDAPAKAGMQKLIERFDAIDSAIAHLALGDLEHEIPAARRALVDEEVVLGRRIEERITDLVATSERTLGKLSGQG
jgi:hypothetical protein